MRALLPRVNHHCACCDVLTQPLHTTRSAARLVPATRSSTRRTTPPDTKVEEPPHHPFVLPTFHDTLLQWIVPHSSLLTRCPPPRWCSRSALNLHVINTTLSPTLNATCHQGKRQCLPVPPPAILFVRVVCLCGTKLGVWLRPHINVTSDRPRARACAPSSPHPPRWAASREALNTSTSPAPTLAHRSTHAQSDAQSGCPNAQIPLFHVVAAPPSALSQTHPISPLFSSTWPHSHTCFWPHAPIHFTSTF
jgi:hypothetical protein